MKLQLALHLPLLTILQLYHLPPPFPPPVSNSSPCRPAVVRYYCVFQGNCTIRLKMLNFCFFLMYYLCEKSYKPITVLYYIADCVNWVPRLTLLDLQTCFQNGTCLYVLAMTQPMLIPDSFITGDNKPSDNSTISVPAELHTLEISLVYQGFSNYLISMPCPTSSIQKALDHGHQDLKDKAIKPLRICHPPKIYLNASLSVSPRSFLLFVFLRVG